MGEITTCDGKEQFSKAAFIGDALKRRLAEHHRQEQARLHRKRKARREDAREQDDDFAVAQAVILATTEQIAAFSAALDAYDAAVVDALLENEEALNAARQAREEILMQAHVLPDGRRVFRTEDGLHVFDEHGVDVTAEVSPEEIDPSRPTWEKFEEADRSVNDLESERQDLLDFQDRVDEARERLGEGGLTTDDLDDMREALEADMPEAVRIRIDPDAPAPDGPDPVPKEQSLDLDAMGQDLAALTSGL
ncbi:hypothetical protein [Roseospira visakhapatnamensis]|uniref:Regulator of sigma D n=1 Tax=Roseospira visakhapatnamensis TaxID=390880 RepID=A0A7W6RG31_9PROT|nr:hypothetical protein [Roseospira visakhapatnamensis]MBB4267911.1 regulator of sigma D [Roseospira visakhapatnamensis]